MGDCVFDYFIALDGPGLDGIKRGFAGIGKIRCRIIGGKFTHQAPEVSFYSGLACGHATQINKQGTLGFLGNTTNNLALYEPRSLVMLKRASTVQESLPYPQNTQEGQTHALWLDEHRFITVVGQNFYEVDAEGLDNPRAWKNLGEHRVKLPHAIKCSPSGRWLCYGSMDSAAGWAKEIGFFDLERGRAHVMRLKETLWHLGVHPTKDVFYAPTQEVDPVPAPDKPRGDFEDWSIGYRTEYLHRFELNENGSIRESHMAFPPALPHHLTSDVVVVGDDADTVIYNCCASSTIASVSMNTGVVRYIDEWTNPLNPKYRHEGRANALDAAIRASLPSNLHLLLRTLRATRLSGTDGSYGLALSPDKKFLLSAHRGLNTVIVYRYPELTELERIPFPSFQEVVPDLARWTGKDPRLGFHHSAMWSLY